MNKFSIPCTNEQTLKALKLGAPIECYVESDGVRFPKENPTAEQMISWLEEQHLYITIMYTNNVAKNWQANVDCANCIDYECGKYLVDFNFCSRKEATLAAIDAALEYLIKNKK